MFCAMTLVLMLALISPASSHRMQVQARHLTCEINGPGGESVTFPVKKCNVECVKATTWHGEKTTNTQKQFALLFRVAYKAGYCTCSIGSRPVVQFRAWKTQIDACKNDVDTAKTACWDVYKKARSTHLEVEATDADMEWSIAHHRPEEHMETRYEVRKTCQQCDRDTCSQHVVPSILVDLSDHAKGLLADTIFTHRSKGQVNPVIADFESMLVNSDRDDLFFEQFQDNDDSIKVDRLRSINPDFTDEQFDRLMRKLNLDRHGNEHVTRDQFDEYQKLARGSASDFEFERLDLDGDGFLSLEDLHAGYNKKLNRAQLYHISKLVDDKSQGGISRDKFGTFRDTMLEHIEIGSLPASLDEPSRVTATTTTNTTTAASEATTRTNITTPLAATTATTMATRMTMTTTTTATATVATDSNHTTSTATTATGLTTALLTAAATTKTTTTASTTTTISASTHAWLAIEKSAGISRGEEVAELPAGATIVGDYAIAKLNGQHVALRRVARAEIAAYTTMPFCKGCNCAGAKQVHTAT